ncbi:MAG: C40 family peptidase [Bacteroidales bacterium]|nr:C40 family peptidase [Bacteroidales bacterium]
MTLKTILLGIGLSFIGIGAASAQDVLDAMPKRLAAEHVVREVSALTTVNVLKPEPVAKKKSNPAGESIVRTALQYIGARYRSGHSGPKAFDCSGFTSYVYKKENISINRSSRSQFTQGTPILTVGELKKGDLVFFGGSGSTRTIGHVGIVTDVDPEGKTFNFVHASRTGVKVDSSSSAYYSRRYIGARRIVEE